jgi:hypothetical protein
MQNCGIDDPEVVAPGLVSVFGRETNGRDSILSASVGAYQRIDAARRYNMLMTREMDNSFYGAWDRLLRNRGYSRPEEVPTRVSTVVSFPAVEHRMRGQILFVSKMQPEQDDGAERVGKRLRTSGDYLNEQLLNWREFRIHGDSRRAKDSKDNIFYYCGQNGGQIGVYDFDALLVNNSGRNAVLDLDTLSDAMLSDVYLVTAYIF